MKKMFFMHVPKCGGTSIKKALAKGYDHKKIFSVDAHASKYVVDNIGKKLGLHEFRDMLVLYVLATGKYNLVMGHSVYNPLMKEQFSDDYGLVSLVRDPISRFVSHFFYNKHKDSDHFRFDYDLEAFIESEEASSLGSFYKKYFSGVQEKASLATALANMSKFDIVGTLEDLPKFADDIEQMFGIQVEFGHENKSPKPQAAQVSSLSNYQLQKIEDICKDDIEIYKEIKRSFRY
ncbi:sulfotransferase family 2 domain-containing protein [Marinobacterium sp. YM272]|uniref:sulfotransferase family 2 domain-containing protein n=1 Tax=Marinobacterium sp. YM272 TaxID=3421654 RepID=UPI003D7F9C67